MRKRESKLMNFKEFFYVNREIQEINTATLEICQICRISCINKTYLKTEFAIDCEAHKRVKIE